MKPWHNTEASNKPNHSEPVTASKRIFPLSILSLKKEDRKSVLFKLWFALFVIIGHNTLFRKDAQMSPARVKYKRFLLAVLLYYLADIFWARSTSLRPLPLPMPTPFCTSSPWCCRCFSGRDLCSYFSIVRAPLRRFCTSWHGQFLPPRSSFSYQSHRLWS